MTEPGAPADLPVAPPPLLSAGRDDRTAELRAAGWLIAVLAVLGAVLGVVWAAWSPPGPLGAVLTGGIQADETEAFVAGDGRFALITVIVGLLAGAAAWVLRRARGPIIALGLVTGCLVGAALTDLVGWAVRGDSDDAKVGTVIRHLPLTVHMHALWFVEATAAVLVYSLFVAFAVADDLGRPDPRWAARVAARADRRPPTQPPAGAPSVGAQRSLQEPWRDGDGTGPA